MARFDLLQAIRKTPCRAALASAVTWAVLPVPLAAISAERMPLIVLVIAFLIISLSLHEVGHAWVAWKRGDPTARDLGRLSVNPIVHIDPFMTIVLPLIMFMVFKFPFGGAKPVPVNPMRLKNPLRDMVLVAIAGPAVNVVLAFVFFFARNIAVEVGKMPGDTLLVEVLMWSGFLNVVLAVFNMLPIPPLDGSRVMTWLLPPPLRQPYLQFERFGIFLVFGIIYLVPGVSEAMVATIYDICGWIDGVTRIG